MNEIPSSDINSTDTPPVSESIPDSASEPETSPEPPIEQEREPIDPAFFLSYAAMQMDTKPLLLALAGIFDGQAWRNLGLVADPRTGSLAIDLPAAQIAIDCVQFILSKTESEFSPEERREAHRRLNDLRVNYLSRLNSNAS